MVERITPSLSETLKAVSDATRRSILTTLVQEGPTRVTELAGLYDMSLNSVSKHIKVLEKSGLVSRRAIGRVHLIEARLTPVDDVEEWFKQLRSIWDLRLESLDNLLTQKEQQMSDLSLTVTRTINADPTTVFDAWLNPKMLAKFMLPGNGMSVPEATTDPVVGGRFKIIMRAGDQDLPHSGEYIEIDPNSKLVFTWQSSNSIDGSTVTLNLEPVEGGTKIELNQIKFATENAREDHRGGWGRILETLDGVLKS